MFKQREDLQNPKLRKEIVDLRREGNSWGKIAKDIFKKFAVKTTGVTCRTIFEKEIANAITKQPKARDQFTADYQQIHTRYEKAVKMVDKLAGTIDELYEKYGENTPEAFLRYAPIILSTSREILNQLEFIRREQERIKVQQKNLIWSPIQINIHVQKILQKFEKEGYLRILKKLPYKIKEEEDEIQEDIQGSEEQEIEQSV